MKYLWLIPTIAWFIIVILKMIAGKPCEHELTLALICYALFRQEAKS